MTEFKRYTLFMKKSLEDDTLYFIVENQEKGRWNREYFGKVVRCYDIDYMRYTHMGFFSHNVISTSDNLEELEELAMLEIL